MTNSQTGGIQLCLSGLIEYEKNGYGHDDGRRYQSKTETSAIGGFEEHGCQPRADVGAAHSQKKIPDKVFTRIGGFHHAREETQSDTRGN